MATEYKQIIITEELYNYLVSQTKNKESFSKTISRLIKERGVKK